MATFTLYRIHVWEDYTWYDDSDYYNPREGQSTSHRIELVFGTEEAYRRLREIQNEMSDSSRGTFNIRVRMESALVIPGSEQNWPWETCCDSELYYDKKHDKYIWRYIWRKSK
jgi:hypothetical protein